VKIGETSLEQSAKHAMASECSPVEEDSEAQAGAHRVWVVEGMHQ